MQVIAVSREINVSDVGGVLLHGLAFLFPIWEGIGINGAIVRSHNHHASIR